GLAHFPVEVVPLTGPFPHPGEDGVASVLLRDVVDELHDDDGLADAGTTEGTYFSALGEGTDQVDHLDPRFEDFRRSGLIHETGSGAVNGIVFGGVDRT